MPTAMELLKRDDWTQIRKLYRAYEAGALTRLMYYAQIDKVVRAAEDAWLFTPAGTAYFMLKTL